MCGIVGALAFGKLNKKNEEIRQRLMRYLTTELMLETEERGKDATGAAILFNDGNYLGIKRGEESSKFLAKFGKKKECYGSLLEVWRKHEAPVKVFIGHCRKGTVGAHRDNKNNHPIKIRNIVGVHNGVIRNDDEIEKHLGCKRDGKVDSEMIFRLFDHFTNSGKEPFTMDMLETIIARLTGAFAVIAFNSDNIKQVPVFRDGRPIEMIFIKNLALLILVSELKFWTRVHFRYERMVSYGEVKLPSLLDMDIKKEMFKDDSAAIFDLTVNCTKDTTIEDLGEFKKIPRNNKVWTTTAALNSVNSRTNSAYNYTGRQQAAGYSANTAKSTKDTVKNTTKDTNSTTSNKDSNTKVSDNNVTKKRVFNNITKKYETQTITNPKTLGENESKVIPIGNTKALDSNSAKKDDSEKCTKVTFQEDMAGQDISNDKLLLDDYTNYDNTTNNTDNDDDVIDVDVKDILVDVKEIDMTVENPEILATAQTAYKNIPDKNRGYTDIDTLLNDIDLNNEAQATRLGLTVVANRVAKVQWINGFISGWKAKTAQLNYSQEKSEVREKYIAGLKSMVIILGQFFSRLKSYNKNNTAASTVTEPNAVDIALKHIASDHISKRPHFDMDKLDNVFNEYEAAEIKDAREIIRTVYQSAKLSKSTSKSATNK